MEFDDSETLLERIGVLRHPCDLDLLVFLSRHPRSLLASEQLSAFIGHGGKRIATSLDALVGAGFLTRTSNPAHAARLYVFASSDPSGGFLSRLLDVASTRPGRLMLITAMKRRARRATGSVLPDEPESTGAAARPFTVMSIGKARDRKGSPPGRDPKRAPYRRMGPR